MVDYIPEANIVPQGALQPGLFIMPAYTWGVSPLTVAFEIHATPGDGEQAVSEYAFSTGDGTIIKGNFPETSDNGVKVAVVPYTYVYNKSGSSKYTGRTFYPDVTVKTKKGAIKTLNFNNRKAAEVWCIDPRYDPRNL